MAMLCKSDGSPVRGVKNLGWLLRNWKTARAVSVVKNPEHAGGYSECVLIVTMDARNTPGGIAQYRTPFGSARLLWDWLQRPTLTGLPLDWCGLASKIGDGTPYPGLPYRGKPIALAPVRN